MTEDIEDFAALPLDEAGNVKRWSKAVEKLKGYKSEEITGKNFRLFYTQKDQEAGIPERLLVEARKRGYAAYKGWRIRKDGSAFFGEVIITASYDDTQKINGFSEITHNLTNAQDAAAFEQNNLYALINNTRDLMWSIDADDKLITANKAFDDVVLQMTGKVIARGGDASDLGFGEEQIAKYKEYHKRVFAGEAFTEIEHTDSPYERWNEISFNPIYKEGKVTGVACFAHDITEQVKADKSITDSEHRFRSLIEHSADAIAIFSAGFKPIYVSPSVIKVLGYTPEEAMQADLPAITHPQDQAALLEAMSNVLANPGMPIAHVARIINKAGEWRWTECMMTNMLHDPAINGIVDNFRDITERKLAEEKIIHANRLYEFISAINQTIVHVSDQAMLFNAACRIASEIGKFKIAWIGIANKEQKKISLVEGQGIPAGDERSFVDIPYDNTISPQYAAICEGVYYVCNDIAGESVEWEAYSSKYGIHSCMALPIKRMGETVGSLSLYSEEKNYFNAPEIALLQEVAGDISFALDVFEKDNAREKAEQKLLHNEYRLVQAQQIAHVGSWERDIPTGVLVFSAEACRIHGRSPEDNKLNYDIWLSYIHPHDVEYVQRTAKEARDAKRRSDLYYRIVRHDGEIRDLHSQANVELDSSGAIVSLYGVMHDITERVRAEKHIKNNERRFRSLIEHSTDVFAIFSQEWDPIYVSPSVKAILGYTDAEVMGGFKAIGIVHPDDILPLQEMIQELLRHPGRPMKQYTRRLQHKDGTWRWVEGTVTNMLHDPAINGIINNFRDITERKLAEEKLITANRLYSLISQVNQAIVRADNDNSLFKEVCRVAVEYGKFKMAGIGMINEQEEKIALVEQFGFTDASADVFSNVSYEKNGPVVHILQTGDSYICNDIVHGENENSWKRFAREHQICSYMLLPVRRSGKIIGTFNLFSDKTNYFNPTEVSLLKEIAGDVSFALDFFEKGREKNLVEKKLRHNEYRLKQAQATANLGSWVLDFASRVLLWSEETCRIYGLPVTENKQTFKTWLSFIHADDYEYVKKITMEAEVDHSDTDFYHRIVRKDGIIRHIHSIAQFEFDDMGKPIGLNGVAHDITEQRTNIIQLKKQNAQLQDIAAIQSHKVRGPLATIMGLTQLLQDETPPAETREIIAGIIQSSEKLDMVIREIVHNTTESKIDNIVPENGVLLFSRRDDQ